MKSLFTAIQSHVKLRLSGMGKGQGHQELCQFALADKPEYIQSGKQWHTLVKKFSSRSPKYFNIVKMVKGMQIFLVQIWFNPNFGVTAFLLLDN